VELMSNVCLQLKDRPLRALMIPKTIENKYHEIAEQLKDLVGSAGRVMTKIYEWTIGQTRPSEDDIQLSGSCEVSVRGANTPPWSSVNNCPLDSSLR
jgi:hypothetical protein